MGIHLRLSKSAYNVRKRIAKGDHAAIMNLGTVRISARCHYIHCTIDLHHIFIKMLQTGYYTLWGYTFVLVKNNTRPHCIQ